MLYGGRGWFGFFFCFVLFGFFNERGISEELNGRLSYRETAIWTISYFQDSGNNKSFSAFSGKKALFCIGT